MLTVCWLTAMSTARPCPPKQPRPPAALPLPPALAKPPPLRLEFTSGRAMRTRIVPSAPEAIAGGEISLTISLVDEHSNCVTSIATGEVELEEVHGREVSGLGRLTIVDGQASTTISSQAYAEVTIGVASVDGFPDSVTMMAGKQPKPPPGAAPPSRVSASASARAPSARRPRATTSRR